MRIYTFSVLEGYEWILPTDPTEFETFFALDGRRQIGWSPPHMEMIRESDANQPNKRSDFPWLGSHAPILRRSVADALQPALEAHGELLPLRCAEPVCLYNVTSVVNALDTSRSQLACFENGDIMAIERHAFSAEIIGKRSIFKLPMRSSSVYVTAEFVSLVGSIGAQGVAFEMVWSDETVAADQNFVAFHAASSPSRGRSRLLPAIRSLLSKFR